MSCRKIIRLVDTRIVYCGQPKKSGHPVYCPTHAAMEQARKGDDATFMAAYRKMIALEGKLLRRT